jgi:hypothetical protein
VQEVRSAEEAILCSGRSHVKWEAVVAFHVLSLHRLRRGKTGVRMIVVPDLFLVEEREEGVRTSPFPLQKYRNRNTLDSRDHVFAFIGMIPEL